MVLRLFLIFAILIVVLSIISAYTLSYSMPVEGANRYSYNQKSFWAYPWGSSGHHKGVDIFAKKGTQVLSATAGIVVFTGVLSKGGNVILILDPSLKFHYYAHLDQVSAKAFNLVGPGEVIATVGTTGNAKGKPPHLHYSIGRVIPRIFSDEDWLKRFYDDPVIYLNRAQ